MKENDVISFLESLGLGWKYLVNGLIGGFIWSIHKKSKFWEAVRQVFTGGIVSGYFTPFIIEKTSVNYAGFISFIIGMIGMVVVDVVYKWAVSKFKLLFSSE